MNSPRHYQFKLRTLAAVVIAAGLVFGWLVNVEALVSVPIALVGSVALLSGVACKGLDAPFPTRFSIWLGLDGWLSVATGVATLFAGGFYSIGFQVGLLSLWIGATAALFGLLIASVMWAKHRDPHALIGILLPLTLAGAYVLLLLTS